MPKGLERNQNNPLATWPHHVITLTIIGPFKSPQHMVHHLNIFFSTVSDHQKNSTIDYKSNSSCSSPSKDMKNSDRCGMTYGPQVPVLPVRNNLRHQNSSHLLPSSRFHFRKGLRTRCSWKCTAIVVIFLSVILTSVLFYILGKNWSRLTWSELRSQF